MLTGYQKRLLFSGRIYRGNGGYTFDQTNGFNAAMAQLYSNTPTGAFAPNPGAIPNIAPPSSTYPSVCIATANATLGPITPTTFSSIGAATRDLVSTANGAQINWQVPSYPMLNILTGGSPTNATLSQNCPVVGSGGGRPGCNMPYGTGINNEGFSVLNVPGFYMSEASQESGCNATGVCPNPMRSSSGIPDTTGWIFSYEGPRSGGTSQRRAVRCVSLTWY